MHRAFLAALCLLQCAALALSAFVPPLPLSPAAATHGLRPAVPCDASPPRHARGARTARRALAGPLPDDACAFGCLLPDADDLYNSGELSAMLEESEPLPDDHCAFGCVFDNDAESLLAELDAEPLRLAEEPPIPAAVLAGAVGRAGRAMVSPFLRLSTHLQDYGAEAIRQQPQGPWGSQATNGPRKVLAFREGLGPLQEMLKVPAPAEAEKEAPAHEAASGDEAVPEGERVIRATVKEVNGMLVDRILRAEGLDWGEAVRREDGVEVWATNLGEEVWGNWPDGIGPELGGGRLEATMARAIVDASPKDIFRMFGRNDLVPEYNEFCHELSDVMVLDDETKVTWGATGSMGPFCPRDFVTRCHLTELEGGVHLAANLAESLPHLVEEHRAKGKSGSYCRMEVLIGGTIARPVEGGAKSEYTILCLTNPGGAADTVVGSALVNKMAATGPFVHIEQIRKMVANERWNHPLPEE